MKVLLPPVFRINTAEDGNVVQQLAVPSWAGEASVVSFQKGRTRGFTVEPSVGSPKVLLITNTSKQTHGFDLCLRARVVGIDPQSAGSVELGHARWLKHPELALAPEDLAGFELHADRVRDSWRGGFSYIREDAKRQVSGLRPPQIGAIYAVQAHWTVNSDPATVVLPTGVGKTETMLSLLVAERCHRLLVVVPTDALRTQIFDKFLSFGLLKSPHFGVVSPTAAYPVVGALNHRPANADEVDAFFRKCNVVVTTMPLASQCSPDVIQKMASLCPCLFIDEAHHVAAPRWNAFKEEFRSSRIVQFTATPFRNDDRPIGGRKIFTFSLRHAQEQGYFKKIRFMPVEEFDPARKDLAVAEAAVEQLRKEAHMGHILMARVNSVARAEEVFEYYKAHTEFNPVQVHTGIKSKTARDEIRRKLISGESRIVVCVDMLGEGFDLPELKIAAFHDIRKSLPVTLQLAGRFTRTKPHLGDATFIANTADLEVKDELKKLYQHEPDWNALLPLISEKANEGEFNLYEFLGGFQELPGDLPLGNVRPSMSTVVYRTKCVDWSPENFADGVHGFKELDKSYHWVNHQEKVLVIATMQRVPVEWAQTDEVYNWDWQLYVVHWSRDLNLLFIHNSSNAGFFKKLAKAVAGESAEQISGPNVFRCLAGINRLKLQNVGLLEQLGRLIRYTMRAGSDVESGLSETQKQKAIKANLFGQGFEKGDRATIGCSYKGRIWSRRNANMLQLTSWCREVGEKLADEALDPEEVLRGTLIPQYVSTRPERMPISIEWPDIFYTEPERRFGFTIGAASMEKCHTDLILIDPTEAGPLSFAIRSDSAQVNFELVLTKKAGNPDFAIVRKTEGACFVNFQAKMVALETFFEEHPPTFWLADGSSLTGFEYVELRRKPEPFPRDRIMAWDWTGTNIKNESQGIGRGSDTVQYRVIQELKKRDFTVIFDDDDSGEAADVVAVKEESDCIHVEFWHCKYSQKDFPGSRIKDLYEVCGQAQNSIRWLEKTWDLFSHLLRRDPRKYLEVEETRIELGSRKDLMRIREKTETQRVRLKVFVVQPGLSRIKSSMEQLELLAVTENYLLETFAVPFGVVASS